MSIKQIKPGLWFIDCRMSRNKRQYRRRENFSGNRLQAINRQLEVKKELLEVVQKDIRSLKLTAFGTFGNVLDYYYSQKMNNLVSLSSFKQMNTDLKDIPIYQIKEKFKEYWLILKRTRSRQTGEYLANSTVNHYTVMAKAAFNLCIRDGILEDNPLKHIPILKVTPRDIMLSDLDKINLLNTIDREAPHLSAIVRFALEVPSRKSELINLKVEDYDAVNNAVRIRHSNAKGKQGSWKPVPPGWLTDYFRNLSEYDTDYCFFRVDRGKCVPLGNFRRALTRCLKISGLPDFHFHDTRAVSATNLLNAGNAEQIVCQIAGWKSGNMIRNYYRKDGLKAAKNLVFPGQNSRKLYTEDVHPKNKISQSH